ncbi:MAG: hydroxymethylbilane synthase [Myxococcota bacterium]|nr:hydroxymethylbilane synthase [Myxococcota bacterium]
MSRLRIATRGSELALTQAGQVAERIEAALRVETELVTVRTSGDRLQHVPLAKIGGKGLFVKEIEQALLERSADVAVHSAKDLPARLSESLVLAAFPERADPRDALVARERGTKWADLGPGARVATGSARRGALLRALRPELEVVPLRGNVTTRLERLDAGEFDAALLACAGLDRLGLGDRIDERLDPGALLPAVGQGVLAIQARAGEPLAQDLAALEHAPTASAIRAERAFLERLEGDCNVPLAAFARADAGGNVRLRGLVASVDGARVARAEATGADPEAVGFQVAEAVLDGGGAEILRDLREAEA